MLLRESVILVCCIIWRCIFRYVWALKVSFLWLSKKATFKCRRQIFGDAKCVNGNAHGFGLMSSLKPFMIILKVKGLTRITFACLSTSSFTIYYFTQSERLGKMLKLSEDNFSCSCTRLNSASEVSEQETTFFCKSWQFASDDFIVLMRDKSVVECSFNAAHLDSEWISNKHCITQMSHRAKNSTKLSFN